MYKKNNSFDYSVSQNFLTSKKTINRIIGLSSIDKSDFVYEIGAGKGHITYELAKRCKSVKAIEIDKTLHAKAQERSLHQNNVHIVHGDFLRSHLPAHEYKIFSNIPFCITAKIIDKILSASTMPSEAWLVMQKGAAKRFCGLPYENKSSLILKPFYDASIVYHFQNSDFHPSPKTKCVLVHFKLKEKPDIEKMYYNKYKKFITTCAKDGHYDFNRVFTKNQLHSAKKAAGIQDKQDGRILYVQWLCLFRCRLKWYG